MRVLFWFAAIGLLIWLIRARWQRWQRRRRGEPEPVQTGPRTISLVVVAILIVYGVLISYRLLVGD